MSKKTAVGITASQDMKRYKAIGKIFSTHAPAEEILPFLFNAEDAWNM